MSVLLEQTPLDARPMPRWYPDAKLGIFVHWGLYSIPAFAERPDGDYTAFMRELTAGEDTRGRVPYATPDPAPTTPWELTRGLGRSFGYNAKETAADTSPAPHCHLRHPPLDPCGGHHDRWRSGPFTRKERTVYAIVLSGALGDGLTIRDLVLPAGTRIGTLNGAAGLAWAQADTDVRIAPPPQPPGQHAQVLTITMP